MPIKQYPRERFLAYMNLGPDPDVCDQVRRESGGEGKGGDPWLRKENNERGKGKEAWNS